MTLSSDFQVAAENLKEYLGLSNQLNAIRIRFDELAKSLGSTAPFYIDNINTRAEPATSMASGKTINGSDWPTLDEIQTLLNERQKCHAAGRLAASRLTPEELKTLQIPANWL